MAGPNRRWPKSPGFAAVNGDKESRGLKRKAKADPYDEIKDEDSALATPASQRTRSRVNSEAPSSSAKGRASATKKPNKRGSRLSGRQQKDDTADEQRVDAVANLARAKEPEAARLLPQPEERYTKASLAPMADMGIPDATNDSTIAATPDGVTNGSSRSVDKTSATKPSAGKATTNGAEADEADEVDEANDGEECEIKALLTHRMNKDVTVELLVHWAGETEDEATWVLEEEIQKGAAESLYEYWKGQGGRINALFIKPKNPPKEEYHVFDILTHMKKARGGGFDFEVQWVGHPPTRGETSMESEARLKKIAKEKVAEYWKSVGGRNKFLEKRGRGKKARTE